MSNEKKAQFAMKRGGLICYFSRILTPVECSEFTQSGIKRSDKFEDALPGIVIVDIFELLKTKPMS